MGMSMSRHAVGSFRARIADGVEVPRPHLAVALARALRTTAVPGHAVATVATTLTADVVLYDQLSRLATDWRVALRRAESEAVDQLGVGLTPGAAHRLDLESGQRVLVVHGDGWSLVGRTPAVLVFVLDVAPGMVIDRSDAGGAAELVRGLTDQLG
jgi:hypothetical protein